MPYQNLIKVRLKEIGKNQNWLSSQTGIRCDYLSKIINGHFKPNIYDGMSIAMALNSSVEALFSPPKSRTEETNE